MKVKEIIMELKTLGQDQEIIAGWYDKKYVETNIGKKLTDEEWEYVVNDTWNREYGWEKLIEQIEDTINNMSKEK